ncbi:hypothetical protein [Streptomyces griseus]|uniref:hypothetical protein n=1 Tax=Streptomyces griseus TaxID=1911 RepID=UPI000560B9FA|nr:hypothetical protein [Streptomyces griseus]
MNARSAWLSTDGQTREDTRVAALGALTPTSPIGTRSGILPGSYGGEHRVSGFWLAGATGTMTATVSSGRAVVQAAESRGAYPVAVTDGVPLTFEDGDALYGRIDLVVLRIHDPAYDGGERTEAAVEIVKGKPEATPTAPAAPGLSLPLFEVVVPKGRSAGTGGIDWGTALTDLRPTTVAVGGILPTVPDDMAIGAYPGQYRDVNSALQRWNGTAWVPYPRDVGGIVPAGALTNGGHPGQYRDSAAGQLQRWNGTAWLPAVPGPAFANTLDAGSTTSTTYTATLADASATPLTLTFTAPPSGSVLIGLGARMLTRSSETVSAYMSPQVTQGSTVIWAADDERTATSSGDIGKSVSTQLRMNGLAVGTTYTVTAMYRSTSATVTCWFDARYLRVDPIA